MSPSSDSSAKPFDETIFQLTDSDALIDWLVRYDEALEADATDHVPLGTTIEAFGPEQQGALVGLRYCVDLLRELRDSAPVTSDSARSRFQDAIDHWLVTGRTGRIDLSSKEIFVGRYRLLKEIGRGGYGVVFLAADPLLGRNVALKLPLPEALLSEGAKSRFTSEGWAAASLDHANVLRVFDAGEDGPICYIVSEYCAGPTLQKWIKKHDGPVSTETAAAIISSLAEAVEHAHSRGILHRDLKPGNVLLQYVDDTGKPSHVQTKLQASVLVPKGSPPFPFEVKLADFGIAKCFDEAGVRTATGTVLGTGCYMAPEQASGRLKDIGRSTDVYGLGAILYELLAGRQVFVSESYADTLRKAVAEEPVLIHGIRKDVPRDLEAVCLKCLEKDPTKRYATAGELAAELNRYLAGKSVNVRPDGPLGRLRKVFRRQSHSMKALLAVLLAGWALTLFVLMVYALLLQDPPRDPNYFDDMREVANIWEQNARRQFQDPNVAMQMEKILVRHRPKPGQPDHRSFEWHYLWHLSHPEQFVEPLDLIRSIKAHDGYAYFVSFSADGTRFATAGADGKAKIYDTAMGKELTVLIGHKGGVNWVEFASGEKPLVVTAGEDGTARLWDSISGKELAQFRESSAEVVAAAFSPRDPILATGDASGRLTLWNVEKRTKIDSKQASEGRITSLAWSPDGARIVTSSSVQRIWDAGRLVQLSEHPSPYADSTVFSPDGELIAVASGGIFLEDVGAEKHRDGWQFKSSHFQSVRFTADGRSLVAVGDDPDLILFCDIATRHCWNACPGSFASFWCVAPSPDSVHFATTDRDGYVRIWNRSIGPQWTIQHTPGNRPLQLEINGTTSNVTALFTDSVFDHEVETSPPPNPQGMPGRTAVVSWNGADADFPSRWNFIAEKLGSFGYSPDGKTVAVGGAGEITLLDSRNGEVQARHSFPDLDRVRRLSWRPDGRSLLALSEVSRGSSPRELSVDILDLTTGKLQNIVRQPWETIGRSRLSQDGQSIAIVYPNRIEVFDVEQRTALASIPFNGSQVQSAEFSPDQTLLAFGTTDGEVHFWDIAAKQDRAVWDTNVQSPISTIRFLPGGKLVVAHSVHGRFVRIWSLDRREDFLSLPLPASMSSGAKFEREVTHPLWQREPNAFAVSPDGSIMAFAESAGDDIQHRRTIYFWDGRPQTASQSAPRVRPALVSSDGRPKWAP